MTPPVRPEMDTTQALSRAGVKPLTPAPVTPTAPVPTPGQRIVSPYYFKYLNEQAQNIRILAEGNGEDADSAIKQFLELESKTPLSQLPTAQQAAERDPSTPGYLAGLPIALFNGITFGVGSEGLARLYGAITGVGARASYDEYKSSYEAWGQKYHKTQVTAEVVGSLIPALAGAPPVGQATTWLRTAGTAAAWGAASGAGNAGGNPDSFLRLDDRLTGALLGGTIGAVTGGVLGAASQYIAKPLAIGASETKLGKTALTKVEGAVRAVTQHDILSLTPEARARERIVRRMIDGGVTHSDAMNAMQEMLRNGITPNIVGIGGRGVVDLVGEAAQQLSPSTAAALAGLRKTLAEQPDILKGRFLQQAVDPKRLGLAHAHDIVNLLETEASAKADPFYRHSFGQVMRVTPDVQRRIARHPELYEAYQKAAAQVAQDIEAGRGHGLPVPLLPDPNAKVLLGSTPTNMPGVVSKRYGPAPFPTELPIRGIDGMKRELDAIVEAKFTMPNNATPKDISRVLKLRRNYAASLNVHYQGIVDEAVKQVQSYGNGLLAFKGPMAARDAVSLGERLWRKPPLAIERAMQTVDPTMADFVRVGYSKAAHSAMTTRGTSGANAAERFFGGQEFGNTMRSDQIRALFPGNPHGADQFLRYAVGQARITDATSQVVQLARQTSVQAVERAAEGSLPVRSQLGLSVVSAVSNATKRLRTHMTQPEADEIAHLATKGVADPMELVSLMNELFFTYGGLVARPTLQRAARRVGAQQLGAAVVPR